MTASIVYGLSKEQALENGGLSSGYMCYAPAVQAPSSGTTIVDQSGRGAHAGFGAGLSASEAWSTESLFFSSIETTAQDDAIIPVEKFSWNMGAGESLLIAFRLKMAAPASARAIIGQGYGTASQGFRIRIMTDGKIQPHIYMPTYEKNLSITNAVAADGSEHAVMFALFNHDLIARTALAGVWVDGARAYTIDTSATDLTPTSPSLGVRIGGQQTGASSYQSAAAAFRDIHMLRSAASVFWSWALMDALASRLHRMPFTPLTEVEFPSA